MNSRTKTIVVGIGEVDDPLPHEPKNTQFYVFSGPCPACQSNGRVLMPESGRLTLICEECGHKQDSNISKSDLNDLTYVYWCNCSKFETDIIDEELIESKELVDFLSKFPEIEIPRWAVKIENGICCQSNRCINFLCYYHKKDNKGV